MASDLLNLNCEFMKIAFSPIVTNNSEVLILGTMPGERSIKLQQYYGHAGNHFWKMMFQILNIKFSKDYSDRKKLLIDNNIALWDVLENCEGEGSSDNNIKEEKVNDFKQFYKQYPKIKKVFFTSLKAEAFYDKYVGKSADITYLRLPSPSSANTWKTFDEKLEDWKIIKS